MLPEAISRSIRNQFGQTFFCPNTSRRDLSDSTTFTKIGSSIQVQYSKNKLNHYEAIFDPPHFYIRDQFFPELFVFDRYIMWWTKMGFFCLSKFDSVRRPGPKFGQNRRFFMCKQILLGVPVQREKRFLREMRAKGLGLMPKLSKFWILNSSSNPSTVNTKNSTFSIHEER